MLLRAHVTTAARDDADHLPPFKRFGMSAQEKRCEDELGFGFLDAWKKDAEPWCTVPNTAESLLSEPPSSGQSRIVCYPHKNARTLLSLNNVCVMDNVAFDFSKLSAKTMAWQRSSVLGWDTGAVEGNCAMKKRKIDVCKDCGLVWTKNWLQSFKETSSIHPAFIGDGDSGDCDVVVDHPVIMTARRDHGNPFFQVASPLNTFLTKLMLGIEDAQIILLDEEKTNFDDLWTTVVGSPNHPTLFGRDLKKSHPKKTCYRRLIIGLPEYSGPMMKDLDAGSSCTDSEMVKAFVEKVVGAYGLDSIPPPKGLRITINSRRDYGGRRLDRTLANEDEVIRILQDVTKGQVESVDFAKLDFKQQLTKIRNTNVLVGMHGAGMVHTMFLPEEAIVVEFFPKTKRRFSFRNLAKYTNKIYMNYRAPSDRNPLNMPKKEMEEIASAIRAVSRNWGHGMP
eukprot:TRINITY_DN782_c0_g1_i3.p1 TRINITY_DN782_c0_g1~~TRINITY_DN782_c0_g1_i3.p1  ORF type:complete len:451 (+),score=100.20 TRINITY_DN782_c0_g1_i3:1055-2407(+)